MIGGAITFGIFLVIGLMIDKQENTGQPSGGLPSDFSYPLKGGAPAEPPPSITPAVVPKPVPSPPPAQPRLPDISGAWRTNDGELYTFQQSGSDIVLTMQVGGAVVGTGRGALNGAILQLQVVVPVGNAQLQAQCSMQAAPNWQSFTGLCSGPRGNYPAHIYR